MKTCEACGTQTDDAAKFCPECGAKFLSEHEKYVKKLEMKYGRDVDGLCRKLIDVANEKLRFDRVTLDYDMIDTLELAADDGVGIAAYVVGKFYEDGADVDGDNAIAPNPEKMMKYYGIGAEAGDAFAQSAYGQCIANGVDGCEGFEDGDEPTGFQWILNSAKQGYVPSLHRATYAYLDGSYVQEVDFAKALECFKAIVSARNDAEWKEELIERAEGYAKFLPGVMDGDRDAMRQLGEWLKSREGNWEYCWGLGGEIDESAYWLNKAEKVNPS